MPKYDFSGWATRNNLVCADGRVIMHNAFIDNDGTTVPLVWNHQYNSPDNVLGHALLKNRDDGVYAYGVFNDTESGRNAKKLVEHGDICSLSIFANKLKQKGPNVVHGVIREVSLVHSGANPGAYIENVVSHSDEEGDSAVMFNGYALALYHSDTEEDSSDDKESGDDTKGKKTLQEIVDTMNEEQKEALYTIVGISTVASGNGKQIEHSGLKDDESDEKEDEKMASGDSGKTIQDVIDTMNEEQKNVLYALVGMAANGDLDENGGSDEKEDDDVKHNLFDSDADVYSGGELTHSQMSTILSDAKRYGSVKESFLAHKDDYGIEDIDWLFPEARNVNTPPEFIKRNADWVDKLMGKVKRSPFSRVKSMFADITADDARAKGYIKGNLKKEEVISLLKRSTQPTTIYKKQKLDRDDVIDITDFDVVSWLKTEMRTMLDEEIARAVLVGDGRLPSEDDHIDENCIRPIWTDADLFTIKQDVNVAPTESSTSRAKKFIVAAIRARKDYQGSGNPILFTTEDILTDMLLIEDTTGRDIYDSVQKLATKLRVSEIVTVPVMEDLHRTDATGKRKDLAGIIVNPNDYGVGADKGGAISMFDDFDIDYNQQKYLIETRCSGALMKPYSAIALEYVYDPSVSPIKITPKSGEILGKQVTDLQDEVTVDSNNYISGTLKYVTGYSGFAHESRLQNGYFLALEADDAKESTTTIFLTNSEVTKKPVTLDAQHDFVLRITNPQRQNLKVTRYDKNGVETHEVYDLGGLVLEDK